MDPTPDEAAQLQTIGDVFTWAGLVSSEMEAGTTLSGSLAAVLGVKPGTKPRVLGVSSCSDFENVLQSWRIRVGDHDRAPTIAEWGMARLVGRACRTVAGATELEALKAQLAQAQAAAPQTLPPAVAGSLSSTATRRIKMSAIISQVDESEVFMMEEKKVIKCYARYEAVFGAGERPAKDCEPTTEQISCVAHLLSQGQPPYTDFSIFGPFGHRIMKRIKLQGMAIDRDGSLKMIELYGPNNLGTWLASYNVLLNILVMLDAVDLGHLQKYRSHVERLAERYGPKVWSVIYQADVRCRLEHMERIRRTLQADHDKAEAAGKDTDFDKDRPWNATWMRTIADEAFWREEVTEPALLILAKITQPSEIVQGDAKVSNAGSGSDIRETAPGPARMAADQDDRGLRPRKQNRTGRVHQVADGRYTHNRTGFRLCSGYQSGQCRDATQGVWCSHQWDTVHQCNKCLGTHPGDRCPHEEVRTPGFVKRGEGKGKNKGAKKGKGKGRPQY